MASASRRFVFLSVCLTALVGVGVLGWKAQQSGEDWKVWLMSLAGGAQAGPGGPVAAAPSGRAPATVLVEAVPVRIQTVSDEVTAVGSLISNESVVLRPEVAGRIAGILFGEGAPVRRGDVLIELDAAVQRAELQQAQANLELAESNFRRNQDLFERKFVSLSSLETSRAQLEVARAGAALAQARFERTRIRAPFDAVAGIRTVSPGDYVKEGDTLVTLQDIAVLKVDFRMPEQYLSRLSTGQRLELISDTLPDERVSARVSAIDPLVDTQGRAVVLRAELDNPGGRLRPGMFVRVRLIMSQRDSVMLVPEQALVPVAGNVQTVYQVVDGKVSRVEVQTGLRRDGLVEIVSGLGADAVVVTAGQPKLRDGATVRVAPEPGAAG